MCGRSRARPHWEIFRDVRDRGSEGLRGESGKSRPNRGRLGCVSCGGGLPARCAIGVRPRPSRVRGPPCDSSPGLEHDVLTVPGDGDAALRFRSASGQDAIRVAGLRRETTTVGIVLFGDAKVDELLQAMGWPRDDEVLNPASKALAAFGISQKEAETIPTSQRADLVLEKVALLDVQK